jgi:hypothetical protein
LCERERERESTFKVRFWKAATLEAEARLLRAACGGGDALLRTRAPHHAADVSEWVFAHTQSPGTPQPRLMQSRGGSPSPSSRGRGRSGGEGLAPRALSTALHPQNTTTPSSTPTLPQRPTRPPSHYASAYTQYRRSFTPDPTVCARANENQGFLRDPAHNAACHTPPQQVASRVMRSPRQTRRALSARSFAGVWNAATSKAEPRRQQDWILKCLQGGLTAGGGGGVCGAIGAEHPTRRESSAACTVRAGLRPPAAVPPRG